MNRRFVTTLLLALAYALGLSAQYTRKTDLPTLYIETFDGRDITSKTEYKYCRMHYVDESDLVTDYDSVSIRGRGNSTWKLSKKPYKIKFNKKEKFLGKGYAKAKKWTLLANAGDKTLMRNAVTSAMGEFASLKFNPAAKFVDMVLNGTYMGTYQISDQVDVRPHRVDIAEQNYPLAAGDDITGGYLLEVDGWKEGNYFVTNNYQAPVRISYPDEDEIDASQTNYIKAHVNKFDAALKSSNFTDSLKGYRAYVDTASLIDWYICTEVSANIDGFYSTFFYKEQGNDRLFWGPLWDYDIAYNNDHRVKSEHGLTSSVRSMMVDIAYNGSKNWVIRMWEDPWFQRTVYQRFKELMDSGMVDYLKMKIDSLAEVLSQSQELNYQKWGIDKKMYHEMVLYSSYDQYVADLKTFIVERCAYLSESFFSRKPQEPTPPFVPEDFYYHLVNANSKKAMEAAAAGIVQNTNDAGKEAQDWIVKRVGESYQLISRSTNQALNDPTAGSVGPTTNVGTQLNLAEPDAQNKRQLWNIVPQGTAGYYNLENVYSQHLANLQGGSSNNNTPILSYTSDSRNGQSLNRLWFLVANGPLPTDIVGITPIEPEEYALAYNPETQMLHFGAEEPDKLAFSVRVFTASGQLVGTFQASQHFSMADQRPGFYIVAWTVSGKTRSVKFRKN